MPTPLESNLHEVLSDLERATLQAGREPGSVELLAVTKSVEPGVALALARLGCRDLAENRLEGLQRKREAFSSAGEAARWHFIGHLQSNKARKVLQLADVVHSVDSQKLLELLGRHCAELGKRLSIYLEVKLSDEPEKHGLAPEELEACVRIAGSDPNLELLGLMTMAPRPAAGESSAASARACFERLAKLARVLASKPALATCFQDETVRLSMGMSGDYAEAIAAGATTCRIGSALFRGVGPHEELSA